MSKPFRHCPPSCPIAASAQPQRSWVSWTLSATTTALILSAASALALTANTPAVIEQPIFLTLPPAPAAAESVAAVSDPAPIANAEAPTQSDEAEPDTAPDLPAVQPVAKPAPPALTKTEQLADAKPEMDAPLPPDPQPTPDALPAAAEPPPPAEKSAAPAKPKVETAEKQPKKKAREKPAKTRKKQSDEPAPKKIAKASSAAPSAGGATAAVKGAKASAQGQSPAAYQKAVMKKIRATKRPSSPGKGVAVVGFAISASGGLSVVKIVKSSGNPALDAAAVSHIQRSAPFPAPPAGAKARFSFEFVGK